MFNLNWDALALYYQRCSWVSELGCIIHGNGRKHWDGRPLGIDMNCMISLNLPFSAGFLCSCICSFLQKIEISLVITIISSIFTICLCFYRSSEPSKIDPVDLLYWLVSPSDFQKPPVDFLSTVYLSF